MHFSSSTIMDGNKINVVCFSHQPVNYLNTGTAIQFQIFQSIAPAICGTKSNGIIFTLNIPNINCCTLCEIVLRWMPQNLSNEKYLFSSEAWCRRATIRYPSQRWTRSMSPYVCKPQWVVSPRRASRMHPVFDLRHKVRRAFKNYLRALKMKCS